MTSYSILIHIMCLTSTDYEIPNGPKFQDPRMSAYSPYLKESMVLIK